MTNVNPENTTNTPDEQLADDQPAGASASGARDAAGLPLRGLAMVLIAVAVLLGLWGLYALTQGDDNGTNVAGDTTTAATPDNGAENGEAGQGQEDDAPGATDTEAAGAGESGDGASGDEAARQDREGDAAAGAGDRSEEATGDRSEEATGDRGDADAPAAGAAGAAGGGGGGGAAGAAPAEPVVNVLNNSTVDGLAEDVYNTLDDQGTEMGEHGNLPGEVMMLPETTVYFHPEDPAGERAANDLAERIGQTNGVPVTTEPNSRELPEDAAHPGEITLVLIGEVVL